MCYGLSSKKQDIYAMLLLLGNTCLMKAQPRWVSGEHIRLMTWWLRVRSPVEATFLSGVFSPLAYAEACEKSSRWLWK